MELLKAYFQKKENIIVLAIALISVAIHLFSNSVFEFHRDELLYFSIGQHLSFGYHSTPPLVGLIAFLSIKLFGYTLFAARIFPALIGGAVIVLSAAIAKEIKGGFFAQVFTALSLLGSILFVRAFGLFQPVCFDIFFWTLALFLIIRFINTENKKYIVYFGFCIGFGLLNKYNIGFLLAAVLLVLPFTKYRNLFVSKQFYLAMLIAIVIVIPNIVWQVLHHFPVISHMEELRSSQLVNMDVGTFLFEQLLMVFPSTLVALAGILYLLFSKKLSEYKLLAFISITVLLLFILLQGKSYYSAGIYPLLFAAGALFFERILKRNIVRGLLVGLLLILEWMFLPMGKPIYNPEKMVGYFDNIEKESGNNSIRRDEDNQYHKLPQDYADMLGWSELAEITNRAWQKVENKECCIIYGENYGEAGAINVIGKKYKLPDCISFSDNFRFWIPRSFEHEITEMIYINTEPGEDVKALFSTIEKVGSITNPLAREYGVAVYFCTKPTKSVNELWANLIKDM